MLMALILVLHHIYRLTYLEYVAPFGLQAVANKDHCQQVISCQPQAFELVVEARAQELCAAYTAGAPGCLCGMGPSTEA